MDCKPLLICNEQEKRRIVITSILYIGTDDYLSTFYLKDCQKFTCSKPLSEITYGLPNYFFQISRSCTVNLNEIVSVKRGSRTISLSNATQLVVSIRRFKDFNNSLARQNITFTG
jgi:DNA-binding LytR/AlgR family response regulator